MNTLTEGADISLVYDDIAEKLGIKRQYVEQIHRHYLTRRSTDTTTWTQKIIYEAIAGIRKDDPSFPYTLQKAYILSTVFSQAGLTEKKKPIPYVSRTTGLRRLTAEEVLDIISKRQRRFLAKVQEHGLALGYKAFAEETNTEYQETGATVELPIDWKYLSKKLGDGTGKNIHTGGGFQALKLGKKTREKLNRVVQGRPIYPTKLQIQGHEAFRLFIENELRTWQEKGITGGFHKALITALRKWNAGQSDEAEPFILPVHIFSSKKQTGLIEILSLENADGPSLLRELGISPDAWVYRRNVPRENGKNLRMLKLRAEKERGIIIEKGDITLSMGILRVNRAALGKFSPEQVMELQEIYDALSREGEG